MSETPTDPTVPETGVDSGSGAGTPGQDRAEDVVPAAMEDDAPLPDGSPEVGSAPDGDDGLAPEFSS